MKILVTGASGFIGGRFARFALEQGFDVRVSGRRAEGVEHLVRRGAEFIPGDLTDGLLVRDLCVDVDAVVHCAGHVGAWGRYQDFHRDMEYDPAKESEEDKEIRALLRNHDFMVGLSYAMDRQRVLDVVWDGLGEVKNFTSVSPIAMFATSHENVPDAATISRIRTSVG